MGQGSGSPVVIPRRVWDHFLSGENSTQSLCPRGVRPLPPVSLVLVFFTSQKLANPLSPAQAVRWKMGRCRCWVGQPVPLRQGLRWALRAGRQLRLPPIGPPLSRRCSLGLFPWRAFLNSLWQPGRRTRRNRSLVFPGIRAHWQSMAWRPAALPRERVFLRPGPGRSIPRRERLQVPPPRGSRVLVGWPPGR